MRIEELRERWPWAACDLGLRFDDQARLFRPTAQLISFLDWHQPIYLRQGNALEKPPHITDVWRCPDSDHSIWNPRRVN